MGPRRGPSINLFIYHILMNLFDVVIQNTFLHISIGNKVKKNTMRNNRYVLLLSFEQRDICQIPQRSIISNFTIRDEMQCQVG